MLKMIFMHLSLFRSTEMTETKTDGKMIKSKQQRSGADVNHSPMSPSGVWLSCGAGTLQWSHPAKLHDLAMIPATTQTILTTWLWTSVQVPLHQYNIMTILPDHITADMGSPVASSQAPGVRPRDHQLPKVQCSHEHILQWPDPSLNVVKWCTSL